MNSAIYMCNLTSMEPHSTHFHHPPWSSFIAMKAKTFQPLCRPTLQLSRLYFHDQHRWHAHKAGTSLLICDTWRIQNQTSFSTPWWFVHVLLPFTRVFLPNQRKLSIYGQRWLRTKTLSQLLGRTMPSFWLVLDRVQRHMSTRPWG